VDKCIEKASVVGKE